MGGYIQKANRVYLIDKRHNIVSYELLRYVLAYQAAIVRDDMRTANMLIERKKIDPKHYNKLAQFLEGQGLKELALKVSNDPEHKFELALSLKKLGLAKKILLESPSQQKWKQLADLALLECDFMTVEEAALNANDLSLLYLLYTSCNYKEGLQKLVTLSMENSKFNIAFNTLYYLGDVDRIMKLLMEVDAVPQAAMFARAYCPRKVDEIQAVWKEKLQSISPSAANALGSTKTHPECFPAVDEMAEIIEDSKEAEIDTEPLVVTAEKKADPEMQINDDVEDDDEEEEEDEELIREPTDYSPQTRQSQSQSQSVDPDSDGVSLPSGMSDPDGVLNGDENSSLEDLLNL